MKTFLKIMVSVVVLAFTNASYAKAECPMGDELRQAKLIWVAKWDNQWLIISNPVTASNGEQWNVVVNITSDLKNVSDVLALAHSKLQTESLMAPSAQYNEHGTVTETECSYSGDKHMGFVVAATNPATQMPVSRSLIHQLR